MGKALQKCGALLHLLKEDLREGNGDIYHFNPAEIHWTWLLEWKSENMIA